MTQLTVAFRNFVNALINIIAIEENRNGLG